MTADEWIERLWLMSRSTIVDITPREAGELRALLEGHHELKAWQLAVAEGLGYVNRPDGQGGYEVASAAVIVEAFRRRVTGALSFPRGLARRQQCHACCQRDATREAVLREATWKFLCDDCYTRSFEKASYEPPDGRKL